MDGGASYRLLGPLTAVRADGAIIDLGPPKQRATLALLLLQRGRLVSTDRMIDALWGEEPPPSALASIQAYVSNLRRALRDEAGATSPIVRRAQGYVLDVPPERTDVATFTDAARAARGAAEDQRWAEALEAAAAALGTWRGELLEDLSDQPWVRQEAEAVEELRTECRETEITALLAAGRVAPALVAAQALRLAHPYRDRACWLMIVALHRAGRTSEALDAYQAHAKRLDAELGLEPGAELRELQTAVLRQEPALVAWPRPASWTGAAQLHTPEPAAEAPLEKDAASSLVGRRRESRMLDEALADVRAGHARWLVLTGPAGIGKTRLAEELVARVRALGGQDAWARCSEEDGAPAWWPIRQVVRALGSDPDALLVPPSGVDADGARFVVYERVAALLQSASTPLVVVIDDVQWADPTSARCLAFLVGALREVGVAIALTLRDGEDGEAVAPLLAALARSEGHRQLTVGPLDAPDVRVLAEAVAGEPLSDGDLGELAARTGGNPLFVCEYARLPTETRLRGDAPLAVRAVLGRRLAGLEPEILQALRAAAVIGDVLDVRVISAATGMRADELADLLDEAADEHVIVPTPDTAGYAFAHGLVREEILAGMPAMRRRRLHARVAAALAGATDGDGVSRRAQHLVAATGMVEPREVLEGCRAAAQVAEQRWASEAAAEWWAEAVRAFDLQPDSPLERDELLIAQVAALARAGRGQTVLDVLDAGLLDAMRAGRASTVGRLAASLLRSAGAWPWTSYGADPGPLLERLAGLERFVVDDPAAHARLLAALAVGRCYDLDPAVPDGLSARAVELAETIGDPDVIADALLGRLITYSGVASHAEESLAVAERLAGMAHREARVDATIARSVASMAYVSLGRVDEAAEAVRVAIADSDLLRLPVVRVQLRWMEGTLAAWRGDLDDARRHYVIGERVHGQTELYYAGSAVAASHSLQREEGTLAAAELAGSPEPVPWGAAIAAARGEPLAGADITRWLDTLGPFVWLTLGHVTLLAEAVATAREAALAPRLLALLAPYAGLLATIGHVGVIGTVDLARGRLHTLLGETDAARALIEDALAQAERTGGAPTAARCRRALAELA